MWPVSIASCVSWSPLRSPPPLVRNNTKGAVTAVTMLDDGRMVLILDVEKVLTDICPRNRTKRCLPGWKSDRRSGIKCVLFADDSSVARTQIRKTLERLEHVLYQATTGRKPGSLVGDRGSSYFAEEMNAYEIQMVLERY